MVLISPSGEAFGFRAGTPPRKGFVEECPNRMKCLRESYCQVPNPNEGNTDLFDIRVGIKRSPSKLKCRQENLPVDGVCCYLREDYMSQVTTRPFHASIPSATPELISEACGIRRHRTLAPNTEFGEIPWQAWITARKTVCGGAIITSKIIATSASCLYGLQNEEIVVRVGEWDRGTTSEKKPHQNLGVDLIIPHPNFNPTTHNANIALILTRDHMKFDYHAGRICLPQPVTNFQGRNCIVTGWGSLYSKQHGNVSSVLRQADVSVLSQQECERRQGHGGTRGRSGLCAVAEGRQNICLGDEASPLVCEMANTGEYILAGLLNGRPNKGMDCDQEGMSSTFTDVTAVVDWIYKFVRQKV